MDLVDRIRDSLNSIPNLPAKVIIGYMQPNETIGLYPLPGSKVINEDWAGNQTKHINYEVAIRTQDSQLANDSLWKISNYLEQLENIESEDNSFQFERIEQNGLPSISQQDTQGYTVFMLDFFVEIITNSKNESR